jgi:hypothetical protein
MAHERKHHQQETESNNQRWANQSSSKRDWNHHFPGKLQ